MDTVALHLAHRWYAGYDLDEPLSDHSSLTRIRQRLGLAIFEGFFQQVVGLTENLYDLRAALPRVARDHAGGCPSCVGPSNEVTGNPKAAALVILERLTANPAVHAGGRLTLAPDRGTASPAIAAPRG